MKKLVTILLCCVFTYTIDAQRDTTYSFGEDPVQKDYYFGFNLIESMNGLIHLVILKPGENGKHEIIHLTKDIFIAQAQGKMQSLANPENIDFFEKFDIKDPNILDDLWRLRYTEYPYYTQEKVEPGWSANDSITFLPSDSQMEILKKFGINRLNEYIYGEDAFRLLNLIERPEWINSYKESY
jgi:hypothetical protein